MLLYPIVRRSFAVSQSFSKMRLESGAWGEMTAAIDSDFLLL